MDLGAPPRGPELLLPTTPCLQDPWACPVARPGRPVPALRFLAGSLRPRPGRLHADSRGAALAAPLLAVLSSPWGHDGWGGPGPRDRVQRPRVPPFRKTHGEQVQVSADGHSRCRCRSCDRGRGAPGAPPSPVARSCHLSARATHRHGAFAEVTPRGQCHQPGTPTALRAGGLDAAHCPQPRAAAGWAGGTGANSKRDDPQGPGRGAEQSRSQCWGLPWLSQPGGQRQSRSQCWGLPWLSKPGGAGTRRRDGMRGGPPETPGWSPESSGRHWCPRGPGVPSACSGTALTAFVVGPTFRGQPVLLLRLMCLLGNPPFPLALHVSVCNFFL